MCRRFARCDRGDRDFIAAALWRARERYHHPRKDPLRTLACDVPVVQRRLLQDHGPSLLRGRLLTESDVDASRPVAVVNETFVKTYFGKEDPIGQKIKFNLFDQMPQSPKDQYFEIIGVVADARIVDYSRALCRKRTCLTA